MFFTTQKLIHPLWQVLTFGLLLVGCSSKPTEYRLNTLFVASQSRESSPQEINSIALFASDLTEEILGTPDHPLWPNALPAPVDMEQVVRSAGPVGRNKTKVEYGLFRKHCVTCHGVAGDGFGPAAALLTPYPRDFRRGTFKFKSTPAGFRPTHEDVVHTLEHGLPGTAMPAFGTLNQTKEFASDVDALAHYVRYLAIRGETERRIIRETVDHLPEKIGDDDRKLAMDILSKVSSDWNAAAEHIAHVPSSWRVPQGEERVKSIARGRELFLSELTACSKCHGENADGMGKSQDFDEWTKDWTIRAGIDPLKKAEWKGMKPYGALKPVVDRSRNLTLGAYRGGGTREDLYRRLVLGIEGSPMPPVARKTNGNPGLDDDQLLDLVEYVYSLSSSAANQKTSNQNSMKQEDTHEQVH